MVATLRQNLIEYAIHIGELHSTLKELFATSSRVNTAIEGLDKRIDSALGNLESSLDLSTCEIALAQFSVSLFKQ